MLTRDGAAFVGDDLIAMEQKMTSVNETTSTQGPQDNDSKRAPVAPQQNDLDRKDAETKEGKPQEGGKPQQK